MSSRDFVEKDFYKALGVPKTADKTEIKKAYRSLARKHHPDANPGDAKAEARFKEVSEAYGVLSDDKQRAEYDEARTLFGASRARPRAGGPTGPGAGGFDLNDLFAQQGRAGGAGAGGLGDLFGGIFGGGGAGTTRPPRRGGDVETSVTLGFEDAARGATVPVRLSTPATCPTCIGSGAAPGTAPTTCPVCKGAGTVSRNQGGFGFAEPCRRCLGAGTLVETPCPTCTGSGRTTRERTLSVRVPPGVTDGQRIRLAGKGIPGERGAPAGDLFVVVTVTPHTTFGRRGDDLTVSVPVTFPEAVLGAQVPVPTMDGDVTLRVPAGTSSGRTFRVRGRGVAKRGGGNGDLLVTVEVAVPTTLSKQATEALQAYAEATPDNPRTERAGAGRD